MSRKILISTLSILATLTLVSAATFAYFSDAGTSNDNVFAAGNFDMDLSNDNSEFTQNVTATWGLASDPGDTFTGDLYVKNTGSVPADHIELKFDNTVTNSVSEPGIDATIPMDKVIEITSLFWDHDGDGTADVDILPTVVGGDDLNGNVIIDLDDLETLDVDGVVDFDDLAFSGTQSNGHKIHMEGRLHPTLTVNQHQGDQVSMDLEVTMNQDVSQ